MKLRKERQKANQFPAVLLFSFSGKKILMAEEPSENPEHLSFKEKLKRFQNKEATPSGSVKVIIRFSTYASTSSRCRALYFFSYHSYSLFFSIN